MITSLVLEDSLVLLWGCFIRFYVIIFLGLQCLGVIFSLTVFRTQEIRWVFYLSQIFTDEQKPFCEQGEQAEKNWPLPRPLPRREGRDHRDTPIRRMKASFCSLLLSTIAITFCEICMPEAFCEFETVRKKVLLNLWVLWEKKLPSVREKTTQEPC